MKPIGDSPTKTQTLSNSAKNRIKYIRSYKTKTQIKATISTDYYNKHKNKNTKQPSTNNYNNVLF